MKVRSLVLISICLILLPLLIQPVALLSTPDATSNSSKSTAIASSTKSPPLPESPPIPIPDYSGVGAARSTHEIANRTDGNQNILLFYDSTTQTPNGDSASVVLPPGWTGYQLDFSIYDLYENRTWALNPSFNGNANDWTSGENDVIGYDNTFSQSWQSGGPDGNGYVRVQEDGVYSGGFYRYDNNDRTWWTQTFSVNRSDLDWVAIKMDYRVDSAWGSNALFNVYVRINGSQVWAKGFQSVGDTNWHNTGFLELDVGLFDLPNSAVELEVGMFSTMTVGYSSNDWMRVEFDNVWLYMKTKVYPSEINLQMNSLDVQNEVSRGTGIVTQKPAAVWTTSPVVSQINWAPTPLPPDPDLDIEVTGLCDLNLFANKTGETLYSQSPSAVGVQFDAINGQNTTWSLYYLLALPTQYWNDNFNFTIPTDWEVTFVSEPQLPTVNKVGQCYGGALGDGYLSIPATDITNSPDGYWYIEAESHNYVDSAELQIWDGGWSPTSIVRTGNITRVEARILDGSDNPPVGVASTQANVSLYEPGGGLWYTELVTPTAAGWVYSSNIYNDGWNTTGGTYYVYVTWDNSTEAGEFQLSYTVQHSTELIPRESLIEAFLEDQPLYPKVRYEDADSHVWLEPPATVEGNWTTGTITFHYLSGTGYWEAEINALDPGDVGQFVIRVNASKSHYDDAFCYIIIDIVSETTVESPQAAGVYIPWRDNATIQIHYEQKFGAGITGATITANWTVGYYEVTEGSNGWYDIELNSTGPGSLGTFRLNVTCYKERHQRQQLFITVTVRQILTDLEFTTPTNIYWTQNTSISLFYNDTDHGGVAITGATVICDWPDTWYVTDMYVLVLRTDNIDAGLQVVNISVSKSFYNTRNVTVQFYVNPLPLDVTAMVSDPTTVTYGEWFWIEVYVETLYGDPLADANVTFTWTGGSISNATDHGGLYGSWFLSSTGTVGVHYMIIFVNRTNCAQTFSSIVVAVLQIGTELDTVPSGQYSHTYVVGESFALPVNYTTILGGPVLNANVTYFLGGLSGDYIEIGNGIYNVTIDTQGLVAGAYTIYITASSPNFDSQSRAISLILTLIPAELQPESPVLNIYWGADFTVAVYFRNTFNDTAILGADINYFWGIYTGSLTANGTPGWYNITIPSSIFAAGSVYDVTLTCNHPGFQFALTTVTINILPVPTELDLTRVITYYFVNGQSIETELDLVGWEVPRGEILWLYFNFTDMTGTTVINATGSYNWDLGSGSLVYENGFYIAKINMTDVSPGQYLLSVTLTRQNYERAQITQMELSVILTPTAITGMADSFNRFTGDAFPITIWLYDTYHNLTITDATLYMTIPILGIEDVELINNGDGSYTHPGISFASEGTFEIQLTADAGIIYAIAQRTLTVTVTLHPVVQTTIRLGLIAAIIGIIILAAWLAYSRVFAIPWLVRKMRKMSTTIGKGRTPHLSNRDVNRIATRPDSMTTIAEPSYGAIGVSVATGVIPAAVTIEEREAEDDIIWRELDTLEGLGHDQKLELFEEMKRIPPKDRVWFIEDLKAQLADGTRFGRAPAATVVPEGVDPAVHARLEALEALGPQEKEAVIEQLRGLSKEEQEEVIGALEETTKES